MIRSILLAAAIATFAGGAAFAQETCESKAVGKDGKALAGAAKTSFMKKCMADTRHQSGERGWQTAFGAAKNSSIAKCEKGRRLRRNLSLIANVRGRPSGRSLSFQVAVWGVLLWVVGGGGSLQVGMARSP